MEKITGSSMVPGQIQRRHSAVAFAVPQADLDISGRVGVGATVH